MAILQYQISAKFLTRAKRFSYWTKVQYTTITLFWYKTRNDSLTNTYEDKYLVKTSWRFKAPCAHRGGFRVKKVLISKYSELCELRASVVNISSRKAERGIRLFKEGDL